MANRLFFLFLGCRVTELELVPGRDWGQMWKLASTVLWDPGRRGPCFSSSSSTITEKRLEAVCPDPANPHLSTQAKAIPGRLSSRSPLLDTHLEALGKRLLHPCFKPFCGSESIFFLLAISSNSSGLLVLPGRQGAFVGPSLEASVRILGRAPHSDSIVVP